MNLDHLWHIGFLETGWEDLKHHVSYRFFSSSGCFGALPIHVICYPVHQSDRSGGRNEKTYVLSSVRVLTGSDTLKAIGFRRVSAGSMPPFQRLELRLDSSYKAHREDCGCKASRVAQGRFGMACKRMQTKCPQSRARAGACRKYGAFVAQHSLQHCHSLFYTPTRRGPLRCL